MADLMIVAAPLLMLAFLYCGWRAAQLLLSWAPATATVVRGGYSELEQLEDFWIKPDHLTVRGWNMVDRAEHREVEEMVAFDDGEGVSHRAPIRRQVQQGWRPDSVFTIWYDRADPRRATAYGPGSWAIGALVAAAALAWIFAGAPGAAGLA